MTLVAILITTPIFLNEKNARLDRAHEQRDGGRLPSSTSWQPLRAGSTSRRGNRSHHGAASATTRCAWTRDCRQRVRILGEFRRDARCPPSNSTITIPGLPRSCHHGPGEITRTDLPGDRPAGLATPAASSPCSCWDSSWSTSFGASVDQVGGTQSEYDRRLGHKAHSTHGHWTR